VGGPLDQVVLVRDRGVEEEPVEQFGAQVRQVGVLIAGFDQELQSGGAEPVGAVDHDRRRVTRPPILDVEWVAEALVEEP
jgi:hypothetical protein